MAIMVKWYGRLRRGWAEDGKLQSYLEWPNVHTTHHMDCVPIYIRTIHFCTAACTGICTLFSIFNGTRDDDVNGKPTVKNMSIQVNQNDEFPYVVSSQHWAYLWLAYPLYCIVSLPCFCLLQVYVNQGVGQAHVHKMSSSKTGLQKLANNEYKFSAD